jgi:hypothetical protein
VFTQLPHHYFTFYRKINRGLLFCGMWCHKSSVEIHQCFEGIHCLHLQGQRMSKRANIPAYFCRSVTVISWSKSIPTFVCTSKGHTSAMLFKICDIGERLQWHNFHTTFCKNLLTDSEVLRWNRHTAWWLYKFTFYNKEGKEAKETHNDYIHGLLLS